MSKLLRTIKISHKIPIAIAIFIALPLLISFIALKSTTAINNGGQAIYENYFVSVVNLADVRKSLYLEYVLLKSHIIAPDDEAMKTLEQQMSKVNINMHRSLVLFEQTLDTGEETTQLNLFKNNLKKFEKIQDKVISLSQKNIDIEAEYITNTQFSPLFSQMQTQIEAMFKTNIDGANFSYNRNSSQFKDLRTNIFIVTGLLITLGLVIGWALINSIVLPLLKMKKDIVLLTSSGELSKKLVVDGSDEISTLSQSFNAMMISLADAQQSIIQTEKLSSLGSLVAGVSHEINTPLGIAVTIGSSIKEQTEAFIPLLKTGKMKRSDLDVFEKNLNEELALLLPSLEKASALIHNFKQVAVDQTSEVRRRFKLADVVDETLATLHHKIKRTDITCEVDIDVEINIDSYPGALGQVITNLFNNTLTHGFGTLNQGNIKIIARQQNEHVILIVSDNGKGIIGEHQDKIFDPFFTTKLGKGGSGLGLHIIFNIVTGLMGGDIKVTSEIQQYTTFTITLPLVAPKRGNNNE